VGYPRSSLNPVRARAPDSEDPVGAVQIGAKVPPTGAERWLSVNFRRIVGFLFLALLVWLVLTQPDTAAAILRNIAAILKTAATNVTSFFTQLLA